MNLSSLSFAAPWALMALLLLPLIWHLLKVTPPKPQFIRFPAVRLLQELKSEQVLATKTPWWIILLRSTAILFLILALAQPVMDRVENANTATTPLVIILDNDWSVIDRWNERKKELEIQLKQAQRLDRPVMLLTSTQESTVQTPTFQTAETVLRSISTLKPYPWPGQRDTVIKLLNDQLADQKQIPEILWISNGLKETSEDEFISQLHGLGDVTYIHDSSQRFPAVISSVQRQDDGFELNLIETNKDHRLQILGPQGNILSQQLVDKGSTQVRMTLPIELRSQAERIRIEGANTPASQYLLDERWRDRSVGLIKNPGTTSGLLDPAHYIRKSLKPHAPLREDNLDILLSRKIAVLFDTNQNTLSFDDIGQIEKWVESGGIYVSFASARLAENADDYAQILPVQLLQGQRTLGGTLSWKRPSNLSEFPIHSPFARTQIGKDIIIKKQILARPEANITQKTWAQLADGTPLITAEQIGKGWSILFHITAAPDWSNLPISGTFEIMMTRLLSLSQGHSQGEHDQALPPFKVFDHHGNLVPSDGSVRPLQATDKPGPNLPPGLYGQSNNYRAFNLGPYIEALNPIGEIPIGVNEQGFTQKSETDLAPWALFIALLLGLMDWLIALNLGRFAKTATAIFLLLGLTTPVFAADRDVDWDRLLAAANDMRLAYMVTGDEQTDQISKRGLDSLAAILRRRTAVELSSTMAYDPERDDPSLFPMIYWPIGESQQSLSEPAAKRLNMFLKTGGFILMDTQGQPQPGQLARLTRQLDIGQLQQVSNAHVLTRSFYLMQNFPGRYDNKNIWVEAHEDNKRDRVSSVLIGDNSWAQAWAKDDSLRPLYAVIPGGELQREQAYRFGVNLVMYILSGNYKGDQVHLPAILQRLGL